MTYALSLLDKSPVAKDEAAEAALRRTVALAQLAERLGYRRFWVAEHHNIPELASSAPEILVAHLLAATRSIRIGSGGVMLQHYSAYKVAESFNLLAGLAPGRVDLGVGKAPGGLPLSTRALQQGHDAARRPDFAAQLGELGTYLAGGEAPEGLRAYPAPSEPAQRFVLGAGPESAQLAAEQGWGFVFARHINGDDTALAAAIDAYRHATGRVPLVAVAALVEEDTEAAKAKAGQIVLFRVSVPGHQSVTVASREQAEDYARQLGAESFEVEERVPSVLAGSAEDVIEALDALSARFGIDEIIIDLANAGDSRLVAAERIAERHRAGLPLAASA